MGHIEEFGEFIMLVAVVLLLAWILYMSTTIVISFPIHIELVYLQDIKVIEGYVYLLCEPL